MSKKQKIEAMKCGLLSLGDIASHFESDELVELLSRWGSIWVVFMVDCKVLTEQDALDMLAELRGAENGEVVHTGNGKGSEVMKTTIPV